MSAVANEREWKQLSHGGESNDDTTATGTVTKRRIEILAAILPPPWIFTSISQRKIAGNCVARLIRECTHHFRMVFIRFVRSALVIGARFVDKIGFITEAQSTPPLCAAIFLFLVWPTGAHWRSNAERRSVCECVRWIDNIRTDSCFVESRETNEMTSSAENKAPTCKQLSESNATICLKLEINLLFVCSNILIGTRCDVQFVWMRLCDFSCVACALCATQNSDSCIILWAGRALVAFDTISFSDYIESTQWCSHARFKYHLDLRSISRQKYLDGYDYPNWNQNFDLNNSILQNLRD